MTEEKNQKIVVLLELNEDDKNLVMIGLRLASVFRKELCLCYNYRGNSRNRTDFIRARLTTYVIPLREENTEVLVTSLLTSEPVCKLAAKLADNYEGIFIIVPACKYTKYADTLHRSPVPFLFVNEKNKTVPEFKKLILAVDSRKQNSETAIWSSYFGRFNNAIIDVVVANSRNKNDLKQLEVNKAFIKTLFQKTNIQFNAIQGKQTGLKVAFESFEMARKNNYDLLVILGSELITPFDLITGLPEKKIINNAGNLPVMVINPRKDNYVLCD